MKFTKIIAGLLAAVMFTLSTISGTIFGSNNAFASQSANTGGFYQQHDSAKEFVYGDFKFAPTDDNDLFLSGIVNFDIVNAEIPTVVNGKKVTHIDGAAFQDFDYNTMSFIFCEKLKSVTIPSGIISIGEGAFSECISLESITIPNTVKEIKFGAFWDCTSLKSIIIPKSVTTLEIPSGGLFNGCSSLTDVYFEGTKEQFEAIMLDGAQKLGNDTIWDGTVYDWETNTTRQVTIHYNYSSPTNKVINGIKYTLLKDDTYSVSGTDSETHPNTLVIPSEMDNKKITVIEESAFKDWKGLNAVVIPNTVSQISKSSFENCGTLKSLTIPSSITLIDENAFKNTFLEYVRFEGTKEQWNNIEIRDGNSTLNDALKNGRIIFNETMSSDKIIDGVKYTLLENGTFSVSCTDPNALPETLNIPSEINDKRVTVIEKGAFANCENLDTVSLPNSITQIPKSAFENCPKLSVFTLPASITLIDENAFNGTYLEVIYFDGTEEQWDNIEIKDGNATIAKDYAIFNGGSSTDPKPTDPDEPNKDTISTPQNIRKGNIYGRIEWDPIEGAEKYYITVENTITDKDGNTITYTVRSSTDKIGSTEEAWADWAFLAMPYSDEQHKITVCAYGNRQYSKESESFYDNYTPPLAETIPMPDSVWGENIFIKWSPVESAAMYWFKILANGEQLRCSYSTTESGYIGLIPNETYDVVMYVIDKNHITFNEKTYSAKIGAVSVESIQPPKISYNNNTDKITVTYENSTVPAIAFWARIKDENGKLVRMERFTDTEYLVGELPNGVYTIDVCTEAYINHNSDLNDFSTWSPSITLNKQVGGSTSTDDTDDENKENPDTSDPDTNTSGSDTSKPNNDENHPSTGGSTSGSSTSNPSTEHPSTGGIPTEHPSTGGNGSSNSDTNNNNSDNTNSNTSGETTKDAQIENGAPNTTIVTPMGALLDSVLTPEELEQYKNGANIKITISSDNIDGTVTSADVQAVKNALSDFLGYKVGIYVDMRIHKSVSGKVTPAHDLNKPVTIQIEVPEDLRKIGREFIVVRVHNGVATVLNDYDENNNTITFSTDKFSTYAIAYKDKSESTTSDTTTSITNPASGSNENPYTGVRFNQNLFFAIGCVSLFIFLVLCFFTGKNGMTEEEKERKFSRLIAWGKRGGRIRAILALTAILLLLTFYYGIGMKTSKN